MTSDDPAPERNAAPLTSTVPRPAGELRPCLRIGVPLALGELGWMSTYIIDALMIGRMNHSAAAIAASALGNTIYYAIVFFAIYLLNGLETLVAQAAGRGDSKEGVRMLLQSIWIALAGCPAVMLGTMAFAFQLERFGVSHEIAEATRSYLQVLIWSTAPLLLYMAFRRFLQSNNRVALISASLITAGAVNLFFDWLLIYGNWHISAMGLRGSAWATVVVRCWMLLVIVPSMLLAFHRTRVWPALRMLRPDLTRIKALLRIGWPSGLEFSLELGISTFMSVLCGRLGTTMLAAHQVTLDVNAFIYMVPTGLAYAAMIRVGQAAGRNDLPAVQRSANTTLALAIGYGTLAAAAFLILGHWLAGLYTNDLQVVSAATPLLWLCSVIILGDAAFVIIASALTGLGDTRTPMWISILCNWVFGMPVAYLLAFHFGYGAFGLWMGRALASLSSGVLLIALWRMRMRAARESSEDRTLSLIPSLQTE